MSKLKETVISHQAVAINEVTVVENHPPLAVAFRILIQVLNPPCIVGATSPDDSVHLVTFLNQELYEVAAILTCDAGYESDFSPSVAIFKSHSGVKLVQN